MADKRIIQLPNTPGVDTATDEMVVDNVTDGTRRIPVGRAGGPAILDAIGMPLTAANEPVVESGNNSNGYWARFADGTQICTYTIATGAVTSGSWTQFVSPATFASNPLVFAQGHSGKSLGNVTVVYARPVSTSQYEVYISNTTGAVEPNTDPISILLIGRWK